MAARNFQQRKAPSAANMTPKCTGAVKHLETLKFCGTSCIRSLNLVLSGLAPLDHNRWRYPIVGDSDFHEKSSVANHYAIISVPDLMAMAVFDSIHTYL
jgi:hypothetical protein